MDETGALLSNLISKTASTKGSFPSFDGSFPLGSARNTCPPPIDSNQLFPCG
uniref:Uncharacterized protein n=1 Tax=Pseudomonas syringae pv. actinidiae TaxID=103796 RepID=M1JLG6_PSESF|nr:hypothetical protein [Pseudomonas syringae pv. actinidiae]